MAFIDTLMAMGMPAALANLITNGFAPNTIVGGSDSQIHLRPTTLLPVMTKIDAPSASTTGTTMTEAELTGGIHVKTPSAAQNWQVPLGTEISAVMGSNLAVGDSFDFYLINLGGTGDIVTIITDTGCTVVGYMGVHPAADGVTTATGAHFRCRNTAADTWVLYRLA